jgi:hypothetical protein
MDLDMDNSLIKFKNRLIGGFYLHIIKVKDLNNGWEILYSFVFLLLTSILPILILFGPLVGQHGYFMLRKCLW